MNVITIRTQNGNALVIGPRMTVTSQRVQRIAKRLKNINSAGQRRQKAKRSD